MNFTRRQPYGVVAKLNPFNHPFRFCVEKAAAPLAAYVAAKRIDRHSIAPHVAHAKVQVELGHIEQATTELNFVVEMDPKNLEALLLLAKVSQMPTRLPDGATGVSQASLERAELNLEAAATLAPQNAQVEFELARVRGTLGKLKNPGEKK